MVVIELVYLGDVELEATILEVAPVIANPDKVKFLTFGVKSLNEVIAVFDPAAVPWLKLWYATNPDSLPVNSFL